MFTLYTGENLVPDFLFRSSLRLTPLMMASWNASLTKMLSLAMPLTLKVLVSLFVKSKANENFRISANRNWRVIGIEKEIISGSERKNDTSVLFSGKFYGVTPCADCTGIETTVIFKPNFVFVEMLKYQERNSSFSDTGRWNISGKLISVSFSKGSNQQFFLIKTDSTIAILNANKKEIKGPLADFFILKRKE